LACKLSNAIKQWKRFVVGVKKFLVIAEQKEYNVLYWMDLGIVPGKVTGCGFVSNAIITIY
jgi:hypothetical protein